MQGDSRYIPNITKADKDDDLVSRTVLQEQFRRVWEMLAYLEGRLGTVSIRDSVNILGGLQYSGALQATKVFNGTSISIPDSVETTLTFGSVAYDPGGMYASGNSGVLTAPADGAYLLGAFISWAPNAVGERYLFLKAGTTYLSAQTSAATAALSCNLSISTLHKASAGDQVYVSAIQDSGGALAIQAIGSVVLPTFWMVRVG